MGPGSSPQAEIDYSQILGILREELQVFKLHNKTMNNKFYLSPITILLVLIAVRTASSLHAQTAADSKIVPTSSSGSQSDSSVADKSVAVAASTFSNSSAAPNTRYGLFGQYDRRSAYGQDEFPEPFLVDDSDLETDEARFDWLHTSGPGSGNSTDVLHSEIEKGFGLLTLEVELPYVQNISNGQTVSGLDNMDLGARYPLYEYVSRDGLINTTFGAAIEVGIPFFNKISVNTEIVPKVFNDLMIGQHFTVQSILGWSSLLGRGEAGGLQNGEYGFVFGYTLQHRELPIPNVEQFIPIMEINGAKTLTKEDAGSDALTADVGFRFNMKPIYGVQPRLGAAYVFPLDSGGRQQETSGFILSAVFEY